MRETGLRMNGGAVMDDRSPEKDAMLPMKTVSDVVHGFVGWCKGE